MLPDWEIWFDCHFSPILAKWMKDKTDWNIKSAYVLKIHEVDDQLIYEKARKAGNVIIISKDADLANIVLQKGAPPKLVIIKSDNCKSRVLWSMLEPKIEHAIRMLTDFNNDIIEIDLL